MSDVLLSVVVTAHGEGRLLRPTLRSVVAASRRVDDVVEIVVVCDTADDRTRREVDHWNSSPSEIAMRVIETAYGESGAARNAGVTAARGAFVALVDGDDLVSEDYFQGGVDLVKAAATPVVAHPEYVLSFGEEPLLWKVDSTSDGGFDYRDLLRHNLWPSSSVARRETFVEHPYRSLAPASGFGPEDWIWNIETSAVGISHEVVRDSAFFYRVRKSGGVNNRHANSVLPPFDLAALRARFPAPSAPPVQGRWAPKRVARVAVRRVYRRVRPFARRVLSRFAPEVSSLLYVAATGRLVETRAERLVVSPALRANLHAAAELDPSITPAAARFSRLTVWHPRDDGFGAILDEALRSLEGVDALVVVPWVGIGGADLVSLNYAKALQQSQRFHDRTAFLGTYRIENTRFELIPPDVRYVHLPSAWLRLHPRLQPRLIAQLISLLDPSLVISVNGLHLTLAMATHHLPIVQREVYATLFAFDRIGTGFPTNPITDDNQRHYLDDLAGLITDNSTTAELIEEILGLPPEQVLVHRQPAVDREVELPRGTRSFNNEHFSERNPFRLIWPHRLDTEKRPDAVVGIARELRRRGVPVEIDVWGSNVLDGEASRLFAEFEEVGVRYRGPYQGGLLTLPTEEYHALLLTSQSEGLPLVLVQSLLRGLPVVATAVGGVPDLIRDGETGLLVARPEDSEGFADAVERLMASRDLRRALIEAGHRLATERHGWSTFASMVEDSIVDRGRDARSGDTR